MAGGKRVVLADTNIIIEAIRTGCWNGLTGHYDVVTVERCREEALSGKGWSPGYVEVAEANFERVRVEAVSDLERAQLRMACPDVMRIDAGERGLYAHANSRDDDWLAPVADKAALRVGMLLGWGDRLVSLEKLLDDAGLKASPALKNHHTTRKLGIWRTEILL